MQDIISPKLEMSQKVEDLDFFEFGKNWKFDDPPSDLIWEKFEIRKILNFVNHPSEKNT